MGLAYLPADAGMTNITLPCREGQKLNGFIVLLLNFFRNGILIINGYCFQQLGKDDYYLKANDWMSECSGGDGSNVRNEGHGRIV